MQSLCTFYIPSSSQDNSKPGAEGEDPELSITSLADNTPPPAPEYHSGFLKNWREHASLAGEDRKGAGASFSLVFILKLCKCLKYDM